MKYIEKNGYRISDLTLGTAQLGLAYGVNNAKGMPTYEESKELLNTALDCGICSFDTARAYGISEEVLGRFFAETGREKTIITKCIFKDETKEELKASIFAQVKDSQKKMGLEKLPFLLLHNESYFEKYGEAMWEALLAVKAEGLVDNIGLSFSDKTHLAEYTERGVFDAIQLPANIFDSKEIKSGLIKKISESGVVLFVRSVYLQGLFFKDTNELPEKIKSAKAPLDKLHKLAEDNGLSMAAVAFGFMRDTEGISSLVLGADTPAQLKESVSLANMPKLSPALLDKILEISEEVEPIVIRPWEWYK